MTGLGPALSVTASTRVNESFVSSPPALPPCALHLFLSPHHPSRRRRPLPRPPVVRTVLQVILPLWLPQAFCTHPSRM